MRAGLGMRGAALVAALLLAACGEDGGALGPFGEDDAELPPSLPPIPYEVEFSGDLPPELASLLRQVVDSAAQGAAPATSRLAIRQRAEADRAKLEQALRAQGYFDGTVGFQIVDVAEAPAQTARGRGGAAGDAARGGAACSTSCPARATASARSRSTSRTIRTHSRRRRPRIWASSPASRR